MSMTKADFFEMRKQLEECGHTLSLLIDLCTSDVELTQRSKAALVEYGQYSMKIFENADRMLRNHADSSSIDQTNSFTEFGTEGASDVAPSPPPK